MDPIHPIVPVTPRILPILPATKGGHIERDAARDPAEQRSRKRRPASGGAPDSAGELPPGAEDDGLGHVDLTA
jgi:hypothetical protein